MLAENIHIFVFKFKRLLPEIFCPVHSVLLIILFTMYNYAVAYGARGKKEHSFPGLKITCLLLNIIDWGWEYLNLFIYFTNEFLFKMEQYE